LDEYEWNEAKNRSNFVKPGLDFADAEGVFTGPYVTFVDSRFDYGEEGQSLWACSPVE
jgi:uncharacterized DUF497 family protein